MAPAPAVAHARMVAALGVLLVAVPLAAATTCAPASGTLLLRDNNDISGAQTGCTAIIGNVDVSCRGAATAVGGQIASLALLGSVTSISGFLRIRNCAQLPDLDDLASLRSIGGVSLDKGLVIANNDLLTSLKGLENLATITAGGVSIAGNANLCYVDLMRWDRIVVGATSIFSPLISVTWEPANCLALSCDGSCSCDFCGGPGTCTADCEDDHLPLIIGVAVAAAVVIALLILCLCLLKKRGKSECDCFCRPNNPKRRAIISPSHLQGQPATARSPTQPYFGNGGSTAEFFMEDDKATSPAGGHQNRSKLESRQSNFSVGSPPALEGIAAWGDGGDQPETNCVVCNKTAQFDCSRCGMQSYCSSECQRKHWKAHREECRKAARAAEDEEEEADVAFCVVCEKPAQFECSRCGGPSYCSAQCQRSHWRLHAPDCRRSSRAPAAAPSESVDLTGIPNLKSEVAMRIAANNDASDLVVPAADDSDTEA